MADERFGTAARVLEVLVVIGWLILVVGGVLALIGVLDMHERYGSPMPSPGLLLGVVLVITGLALIVGAQMGLAQIATARATEGILDHLRRADGSAAQSSMRATRAGDVGRRKELPVGSSRGLVKVYKEVAIERTGNGFIADGQVYATVLEAERAIDAARRGVR